MPARSSVASPADWLAGSRPRTLPAAVAPVLAGTGIAAYADGAVWWKALLALVVSLALQVAVNYANDYSDGIRGTDDDRVGPMRLVGSGAAPPRAVKTAAFLAFGVAAAAGLVLAATTAWWLLAVGRRVLAAWFYTGGAHPYGYLGLGEVMVFVFFGLVAVVGTTYVQTEELTWPALYAAVGIGALACALLVANNLRDIPTDTVAGKRTLAVVLGDAAPGRCTCCWCWPPRPRSWPSPSPPPGRHWPGWASWWCRARRPDRAGRRHRAGADPGAAADRAGRAGLGGAGRGAASLAG